MAEREREREIKVVNTGGMVYKKSGRMTDAKKDTKYGQHERIKKKS